MKQSRGGKIALCIVMLSIACAVALPFYYIIVNTFKTQQQTSESPLGLPSSLSLSNYRQVLDTVPIWHSMWNTLYVTVLSVLLMLLVGTMAAYGVVMRRTRSSRRVHLVLVMALAVPFQVILVPLYRLFVSAHLVDSLNGLVILYSTGSIFCYFLIQGYMSTLPMELIESARIDGAGEVRIFWRIVVPLIRPILVTVGVLQTMWVWNDFLVANTFIVSPQHYTLVMQVYSAVGEFTTDWPDVMTITVLSLIPITIFFVIMQRQIVNGLVAGAVKG
ncbi:MAG: carbohydrate ABC transporter permease [Streptosporangiaceae bacterium]|jgi:raffinose/stachyose/melibiose transport system permease protein